MAKLPDGSEPNHRRDFITEGLGISGPKKWWSWDPAWVPQESTWFSALT